MSEFDYKGFMRDFAIADLFGEGAVRDTYNRAKEEWKDNADYYGSFVMTLNHRLWWHYDNGNENYARLYDELWREANESIYELFEGEELSQIIQFLD